MWKLISADKWQHCRVALQENGEVARLINVTIKVLSINLIDNATVAGLKVLRQSSLCATLSVNPQATHSSINFSYFAGLTEVLFLCSWLFQSAHVPLILTAIKLYCKVGAAVVLVCFKRGQPLFSILSLCVKRVNLFLFGSNTYTWLVIA